MGRKVLEEFKGEKVPEPDIYLEKPVEPQELVDAIRKIIRGCTKKNRCPAQVTGQVDRRFHENQKIVVCDQI